MSLKIKSAQRSVGLIAFVSPMMFTSFFFVSTCRPTWTTLITRWSSTGPERRATSSSPWLETAQEPRGPKLALYVFLKCLLMFWLLSFLFKPPCTVIEHNTSLSFSFCSDAHFCFLKWRNWLPFICSLMVTCSIYSIVREVKTPISPSQTHTHTHKLFCFYFIPYLLFLFFFL